MNPSAFSEKAQLKDCDSCGTNVPLISISKQRHYIILRLISSLIKPSHTADLISHQWTREMKLHTHLNDISVPNILNVQKEVVYTEKTENYWPLAEEMQNMWQEDKVMWQ
jgi:hypothetical protein